MRPLLLLGMATKLVDNHPLVGEQLVRLAAGSLNVHGRQEVLGIGPLKQPLHP